MFSMVLRHSLVIQIKTKKLNLVMDYFKIQICFNNLIIFKCFQYVVTKLVKTFKIHYSLWLPIELMNN